MQIRSAIPEDTGAWLEMRNNLWPGHERKWHAREIERYFAGELRNPLEVLVAVSDDRRLAGFVELSIRRCVGDCETETAQIRLFRKNLT